MKKLSIGVLGVSTILLAVFIGPVKTNAAAGVPTDQATSSSWTPIYSSYSILSGYGNWTISDSALSQTQVTSLHNRIVGAYSMVPDYYVLAKVKFNQGKEVGICARMDYSGNGYCFTTSWGGGTGTRISKFLNDQNPLDLGAGSNFSVQTGLWYDLKLQVSGNIISGKIWKDGTTEPTSWNATANIAGYNPLNMNIGFYTYQANVDIDLMNPNAITPAPSPILPPVDTITTPGSSTTISSFPYNAPYICVDRNNNQVNSVTGSNSAFTVSAWVNPSQGNKGAIITKSIAYEDQIGDLLLEIHPAWPNKLSFKINTGSLAWYPDFEYHGNINIPNNQWSLVAATNDGNGNIKLYVNGVEDTTTAGIGGRNFGYPISGLTYSESTLHSILLGEQTPSDSYSYGERPRFTGDIADARTYNYAMTNSDISSLYSAGIQDNATQPSNAHFINCYSTSTIPVPPSPEPNPSPVPGPIPTPGPTPYDTIQCTDIKNVMGIGATDAKNNGEVTILQNFLNLAGFMSASSTGYYGSETQNAVKQFQSSNGINNTGYFGTLTKNKVKSLTCTPGPVPPSPNPIPPSPTPHPVSLVPVISDADSYFAHGIDDYVYGTNFTGATTVNLTSDDGLQNANMDFVVYDDQTLDVVIPGTTTLTAGNYLLTVSNSYGTSNKFPIILQIPVSIVSTSSSPTVSSSPNVTMTVTQGNITQGSSTTIMYSASNASSCTSNIPGFTGALSGTLLVYPSTTTTYTISCTSK